jgi:hypothetical protein
MTSGYNGPTLTEQQPSSRGNYMTRRTISIFILVALPLTAGQYRTSAWITIGFLTHAYGMHQGFLGGQKFADHANEAELKRLKSLGYIR